MKRGADVPDEFAGTAAAFEGAASAAPGVASISRHHQVGNDVLREVFAELDLSEVNQGAMK